MLEKLTATTTTTAAKKIRSEEEMNKKLVKVYGPKKQARKSR